MAKILAADDDPVMIEYYKALFSEAGVQVETASDYDSALDKFLDVKPDLLVMDVDMPGGGGKRMFLMVRKILALGIPVVFVTGLPETVVDYALANDNVSIFRKPVTGDALIVEVKRLLRKKTKSEVLS